MAVSGLSPKTLSAVTVATAGTRQKLVATTTMVYAATVVSLSTNTGTQYIGDSTVAASNGLPFPGDGCIELDVEGIKAADQFDLSKWYVDSSTNGAEFRIIAWVRE